FRTPRAGSLQDRFTCPGRSLHKAYARRSRRPKMSKLAAVSRKFRQLGLLRGGGLARGRGRLQQCAEYLFAVTLQQCAEYLFAVTPTISTRQMIDPFDIPTHWLRWGGCDFGWTHFAAFCELTWDRDLDIVYLVRTVRLREQTPIEHAQAVRHW